MSIVGRWVAGDQVQGDRDYQEDDFSVTSLRAAADLPGEDGLLLVLADGMGGHAGGAVASRTVVETFRESFNSEDGIAEQFSAGIEAANAAVRAKQESAPALSEMGSTLVAALVVGSALYWASVGDSLLWLFRNGRLLRLNEDHSMRPLLLDLVELGRMTEEEALGDARLHQLRSAIFGETVALVDLGVEGYPLQVGDLVLLASDGLETLSEGALTDALRAGGDDAQAIVRALLDGVAARGAPGQDNATVLVYRVGRAEDSLHGALAELEAPGGTDLAGREKAPASANEAGPGRVEKPPAERRGFLAGIIRALAGNGQAGKGGAGTP